MNPDRPKLLRQMLRILSNLPARLAGAALFIAISATLPAAAFWLAIAGGAPEWAAWVTAGVATVAWVPHIIVDASQD